MSNLEKKFLDLAVTYLKKSLKADAYSSDRTEAVMVALTIIYTLLEEEAPTDGGQMD